MEHSIERVAVLGAGSWGATLAALLAGKGHSVALWEFDQAAAKALAASRKLAVLPELNLPPSIEVTHVIDQALKGRSVIVSATPSSFVRATMSRIDQADLLSADSIIISVSKGLEENTQKRMSEIILEETGISLQRVAVLSGPSHAEEVCRGMPTATVAASENAGLTSRVQSLFTSENFRVYTQTDLIGVELGGTLKNVFAIACGISDGLGLGDNSKAAIMTRGLNEMSRLGLRMGAQLLTFFGLAGMGDLIVTCLSKHSRNRSFGEKVGQGKTPKQALSEMTMVTEGYKTAPAAQALAQRLKVECPLMEEIYQVLYKDKDPRVSMRDLMDRDTPSEWRELKGISLGGPY